MSFHEKKLIKIIKPKEKHYKPIYRWKADLDKAIEVVRKMLPYLSKRRQIQFHETVGKYENRS